eukprot:8663421-Lingulodinium_polyedra.AAC.1
MATLHHSGLDDGPANEPWQPGLRMPRSRMMMHETVPPSLPHTSPRLPTVAAEHMGRPLPGAKCRCPRASGPA